MCAAAAMRTITITMIIRTSVAEPGMFDTFVIVDWSAANQPKTGRDSIWICAVDRDGSERLIENPHTRHRAKNLLSELLSEATARGERVLLGFDFPFGYPAGFAQRLGLNAAPPWRAVWDEIASRLKDAENNKNDRFTVAADFNRRVSNGSFPFWGCPVGFTHEFLGPKHHNGHVTAGLAEKRLIDCWMVGAQPCWKLAYTGSVGSQSLTGIPVVRALRDDPGWAEGARIWPFETGLRLPDNAQIVFAEVWPSWWRREIRHDYGPPNDRAQVRTVAELFASADRTGELPGWFAGDPNLTAEQRHLVETEEAWTLGVTAPRRRRVTPSPPLGAERVGVRWGIPEGPRASRPHHAAGTAAARPKPTSPSHASGVGPSLSPLKGGEGKKGEYDYLRDPGAIYRRSFAAIRAEADLARFPPLLRPLALRLAHAAGDVAILDDLAWSRGAVPAGRRALAAGAPILVDATMVAAGIIRDRLPAQNPVVCTLQNPEVPEIAAAQRTTRSAASVELWRPHLKGAVVAIGNAPTALFRLLELLAAGADRPALVLGFPVGFVGAAEAKEALIGFGHGLAYIALKGRRGGSAPAAAAVNALAAGARA
jgi:precorrin-8X/cobalt-precorrin-8 methylmutase